MRLLSVDDVDVISGIVDRDDNDNDDDDTLRLSSFGVFINELEYVEPCARYFDG